MLQYDDNLPGGRLCGKPTSFQANSGRAKVRYSASGEMNPQPSPEAAPQQVAPAVTPAVKAPRAPKPPAPSTQHEALPSPDVAKDHYFPHFYPGADLKNMGPAKKLQSVVGSPSGLNATRYHFANWASRSVSDNDILDMMCIPRVSHNSDPTHPVMGPHGVESVISPSGASPAHGYTTTLFHTDSASTVNYGFQHGNSYKLGPDGKPFLYFGMVEHAGDDFDGKKALSIPHVLWNAATAAHRNGIEKIKLHAALGGGYVGGIVWPKLGFDSTLKDAWGASDRPGLNAKIYKMQKNQALHDVVGKAPVDYTLFDYLRDPTAYKRYFSKAKIPMSNDTKHQFPFAANLEHAFFDTHPDSRSMKILHAYLNRIEGKK